MSEALHKEAELPEVEHYEPDACSPATSKRSTMFEMGGIGGAGGRAGDDDLGLMIDDH